MIDDNKIYMESREKLACLLYTKKEASAPAGLSNILQGAAFSILPGALLGTLSGAGTGFGNYYMNTKNKGESMDFDTAMDNITRGSIIGSGIGGIAGALNGAGQAALLTKLMKIGAGIK